MSLAHKAGVSPDETIVFRFETAPESGLAHAESLVRGTLNAVCCRVLTMLITWVCASTTFCVAFLYVAAHPAPRLEEESVTGSETAPSPQPGIMPESVIKASPSHEPAISSPCQAA